MTEVVAILLFLRHPRYLRETLCCAKAPVSALPSWVKSLI